MKSLIWFLASSCLLLAKVNADTDHGLKQVNPGDDMTLWPNVEKGTAVTKWKFETCEGCRIILSCVILLPSCDDHVLTINDGQTTKTFCGEDINYALRNSHRNKMSLTMKSAGGKTGSYCRLLVTKPYTNMKYDERDSSEDGSGKGAIKKTSCKCGWTNKSPRRIVGGHEAGINEYPFAVLIMLKRRQYPYCGGSIITPYHVLTAAHCTQPFRGIRLAVIIGEHDTRTDKETPFTRIIDVEKTYEHSKYVDRKHQYDIAIMKLKDRIEYNDAVGPVCLPNFSNKKLLDEYVKVMGWGLLQTNGTVSPVLLKVNLKVLEFDICKTIFASVEKTSNYQLCTWAPNRDSCQGDSGGPLVWQNPETKRLTQVALVSFGRDCGSPDPAVNSDVSYFMDWIRKTVADTAPEEICV
uniref:Venom S1 protease 11 n=1 Tax=Platymeris rhadamanthus TaxID=1134088 RepID=A0A6B9KZ82_PLARH|nr:venom S1 protease 11 [Platymeris rhadamanthus]